MKKVSWVEASFTRSCTKLEISYLSEACSAFEFHFIKLKILRSNNMTTLGFCYDPNFDVQDDGFRIFLREKIDLESSHTDIINFLYRKMIYSACSDVTFSQCFDKIKTMYELPFLIGDIIGEIRKKFNGGFVVYRFLTESRIISSNIYFNNQQCTLLFFEKSYYERFGLGYIFDNMKRVEKPVVRNQEISFHLMIKGYIGYFIVDFKNKKVRHEFHDCNPKFKDDEFYTFEFHETDGQLAPEAEYINIESKLNEEKIINSKQTKKFWSIIKSCPNALDKECLRSHLSQSKPRDLAIFHNCVEYFMDILNDSVYSDALEVTGNSDDLFSYVRGTVILSGEEKFKSIYEDPKLISEFDGENTELFESLEFIAQEVALDDLALCEDKWENYLEKNKVEL